MVLLTVSCCEFRKTTRNKFNSDFKIYHRDKNYSSLERHIHDKNNICLSGMCILSNFKLVQNHWNILIIFGQNVCSTVCTNQRSLVIKCILIIIPMDYYKINMMIFWIHSLKKQWSLCTPWKLIIEPFRRI